MSTNPATRDSPPWLGHASDTPSRFIRQATYETDNTRQRNHSPAKTHEKRVAPNRDLGARPPTSLFLCGSHKRYPPIAEGPRNRNLVVGADTEQATMTTHDIHPAVNTRGGIAL